MAKKHRFSFSREGYMPRKRAERLDRGKMWAAELTEHPGDYGLDAAGVIVFNGLVSGLNTAMLKLADTDHRCHADFLHADACDTALQRGMRNMKKEHLTKPPLSDEQLGLFKLTAPNPVHSEHHTPQGYAVVNVVNTGYAQISAFFDEAIDTIADPVGDRASYMYRHWLEGTADAPLVEKVGTTRRSSRVINYGAEQVGKKGYISVCFQGTDGSQGPWSEVRGFTLS